MTAALEEQLADRVKLRFSVRDSGIGMTPEQKCSTVPGVRAGGHFDHAKVRRHRARTVHLQATG